MQSFDKFLDLILILLFGRMEKISFIFEGFELKSVEEKQPSKYLKIIWEVYEFLQGTNLLRVLLLYGDLDFYDNTSKRIGLSLWTHDLESATVLCKIYE